MDRRQFFGAAARTAAGAGAIGWLSHYFLGAPAWAGDDAKAVAAMGNVTDAHRRASSLGKPLLVLVIPAKDDQKHARGKVFGALLNHGGTGVYLDLALCELVCATVAETNLQLPDLKVEGEPLMLLVETAGATPRPTPIDPQIRYDISWRGDREKMDQLAKERLDTVAAALRAAVAPDEKAVAARAALVEARLPAVEAKAIRAAVDAGKAPQPEALARGAAIVRACGRPEVLDALAAAAKARVVGAPPPGAKWANSKGCGVDIEGERTAGVKCGMGCVPAISERFLWFFTQ